MAVAVDGEEAGSFVTLFGEDGVQVTCMARFLAGPDGPELGPEVLSGWDVASASAPPSGTLYDHAQRSGRRTTDELRTVGAAEAAHLCADYGRPLMRRMAMPRAAEGRGYGFTLVELLVAALIAAVCLSAAFAWLWNVAALAGGADDRAQAATLASAVSRAVAADVHAAVCVVEPPPGRDPSRSLALVHDHAAAAAENVLIVWDAARGVVWRNASGTYLSDHVTQFDVAYVLADGSLVDGEHVGPAAWTSVCAVRVELAAAVGSITVRRSVEASVGSVVSVRRSTDGFAMLAALLVVVLAATFALVVVGAVLAVQSVEGADAAARRATAAEGQALAAVTRSLRWRPSASVGAVEGVEPGRRSLVARLLGAGACRRRRHLASRRCAGGHIRGARAPPR